jgi:hypothetical protein
MPLLEINMEMNWSRWFRCESSFELLLVPNQPGVFALAEEVAQAAGPYSRRMLAVFEVQEAEDLAWAMSRLFAATSPLRAKLEQARCYVRYSVAPSTADRRAAAAALRTWLHSQREVASQVFEQSSEAAEGRAAELRGASEETELKTVAERAVDRVTQGMKLSKASAAGL